MHQYVCPHSKLVFKQRLCSVSIQCHCLHTMSQGSTLCATCQQPQNVLLLKSITPLNRVLSNFRRKSLSAARTVAQMTALIAQPLCVRTINCASEPCSMNVAHNLIISLSTLHHRQKLSLHMVQNLLDLPNILPMFCKGHSTCF